MDLMASLQSVRPALSLGYDSCEHFLVLCFVLSLWFIPRTCVGCELRWLADPALSVDKAVFPSLCGSSAFVNSE